MTCWSARSCSAACLRRGVLAVDERHVGIMLPPSAGAVVANLALTFDRRVVVNLNYTLTAELVNKCIKQAGIEHLITSRRFIDRLPIEADELECRADLPGGFQGRGDCGGQGDRRAAGVRGAGRRCSRASSATAPPVRTSQ